KSSVHAPEGGLPAKTEATPSSDREGAITNRWLVSAAHFVVKIMCGKECSTANAPENEAQAKSAVRLLTSYQHLQNAYETATALRRLHSKGKKLGALIDDPLGAIAPE